MAVTGGAVKQSMPAFCSDSNVEVRPRRWASFGLSSGLHLLGLMILVIITFLRPICPVPRCDQAQISLLTISPIERWTTEISSPRWTMPQQILANRSIPPRIVAPPAVRVNLSNFPVASIADAGPPAIRLREQPRLNTFPGADSSLPKPAKATNQVQTGGFGDPNAVAAAGLARRSNIAHTGSFDLPVGTGEANGSGGTKRSHTIETGGAFGPNNVSLSLRNPSNAVVHESGFGDRNAGTSSVTKPEGTPSRPQVIPAEIIFKPTPAYTPEARSLKIEGEVVAEVLLSASGQARLVRMLNRLGHGLDESTAHTVGEMRFKPATENGRAVDSVVVIHILFKLA